MQDVAVHDNQHVTAGQVLYRLDPRQFQIALDNAKANLAQTALSIDAMKQDYKRMLSDAAAQQAQVDSRSDQLRSRAMLLHSGTASQAMYDQAHYTLLDDKSKLAALREQAQMQLARLGGNADIAARNIRNTCRPRRRSMRRSASLTTPCDGAVRGNRHGRALDRTRQVLGGLDDRLLPG